MATSPPTARRIYLTQRLVNKQITMEEATELFTLMNREVDRLNRQVVAVAGVPAAPGGRSPPPPPPGWAPKGLGPDNLEELLLIGGPLLGILAALMKRSGLDALGSPPSKTLRSGEGASGSSG
ncbi:MAG: hypothetical protein KGJ23_06270 [Euryarchaeota archaeon]|nr:hypothetical protein [Euryarchaeota archaeon]MDE1836205.1 hypothetical protein [Euryarchaeota archaeon]MDE1881188.1 hypothetical protein [Euryarchaeota archaeon]MDE2045034.1 hypothetical protein [Thermoplasmata archaeon]